MSGRPIKRTLRVINVIPSWQSSGRICATSTARRRISGRCTTKHFLRPGREQDLRAKC